VQKNKANAFFVLSRTAKSGEHKAIISTESPSSLGFGLKAALDGLPSDFK
jgi:hypothetical protein